MNRLLVFLFALICATVTVSSACVASPSDWVRLRLEAEGDGKIHASFHDEARSHDHVWSTGLAPAELAGLDVTGFRASGTRPLHFAVVREAGRLDCSGNGGNSQADGNCSFTADPAFTHLLVSHGIGQPTRDQAFGLMAINARRELIDSLAAAHYPAPTIDDLMALTALGADGRYIGDLARAGYRPQAIHSLIEFKALNITPDWIGGLARIGYANVPSHQLVQMKAMAITTEFIGGFDRIGYRQLPVDQLVQLKALNVTPEFALAANRQNDRHLSVDQLVQMKAIGLGPRTR